MTSLVRNATLWGYEIYEINEKCALGGAKRAEKYPSSVALAVLSMAFHVRAGAIRYIA